MLLHPTQLLVLAQEYARAEGVALSSVGVLATGNDKTFLRILGGGTINMRTAERAESWLRHNWPDGAQWPVTIPGGPYKIVAAGTRPRVTRGKRFKGNFIAAD